MNNKEKKLSSLNSLLILLQQLQVKYYSKCGFHLNMYQNGCLDVFIIKDEVKLSDAFSFYTRAYVDEWKSTYQDLLLYLKKIDNEEQK